MRRSSRDKLKIVCSQTHRFVGALIMDEVFVEAVEEILISFSKELKEIFDIGPQINGNNCPQNQEDSKQCRQQPVECEK